MNANTKHTPGPWELIDRSTRRGKALYACIVERDALRAENARIIQDNEELKRQIQQLRSQGNAEPVLALDRQQAPGR